MALAASPPANDDLANATLIEGLPYTDAESTLEATSGVDDQFCATDATATVWYRWEAPGAAQVSVDTLGSDYDTVLSAYSASSGVLTQLACNDDAGGGVESQLTFQAEEGHVYYFLVGGVDAGGSLELTVQVVPPLAQIAVRATAAYEVTPSAGVAGIAWAQRGSARTSLWSLYALPVDGKVKVNAAGTNGYSGGFQSDEVVYQEAKGSQSNVRFFDLLTHQRRSPPAGVNTRGWEWHPTISGDWLLFGRRNFATHVDRVVLRNLATGQSIVLDRLGRTKGGRIAEAGQVNGNYAVWYRCGSVCNVYRYDIANATKSIVPRPTGKLQYDPSVSKDGTVYFIRSGYRCGSAVRLVRYPLGGPEAVLTALPRGYDSFHTYADDEDGNGSDVYFERMRCTTGASDVLKVIDP